MTKKTRKSNLLAFLEKLQSMNYNINQRKKNLQGNWLEAPVAAVRSLLDAPDIFSSLYDKESISGQFLGEIPRLFFKVLRVLSTLFLKGFRLSYSFLIGLPLMLLMNAFTAVFDTGVYAAKLLFDLTIGWLWHKNPVDAIKSDAKGFFSALVGPLDFLIRPLRSLFSKEKEGGESNAPLSSRIIASGADKHTDYSFDRQALPNIFWTMKHSRYSGRFFAWFVNSVSNTIFYLLNNAVVFSLSAFTFLTAYPLQFVLTLVNAVSDFAIYTVKLCWDASLGLLFKPSSKTFKQMVNIITGPVQDIWRTLKWLSKDSALESYFSDNESGNPSRVLNLNFLRNVQDKIRKAFKFVNFELVGSPDDQAYDEKIKLNQKLFKSMYNDSVSGKIFKFIPVVLNTLLVFILFFAEHTFQSAFIFLLTLPLNIVMNLLTGVCDTVIYAAKLVFDLTLGWYFNKDNVAQIKADGKGLLSFVKPFLDLKALFTFNQGNEEGANQKKAFLGKLRQTLNAILGSADTHLLDLDDYSFHKDALSNVFNTMKNSPYSGQFLSRVAHGFSNAIFYLVHNTGSLLYTLIIPVVYYPMHFAMSCLTAACDFTLCTIMFLHDASFGYWLGNEKDEPYFEKMASNLKGMLNAIKGPFANFANELPFAKDNNAFGHDTEDDSSDDEARVDQQRVTVPVVAATTVHSLPKQVQTTSVQLSMGSSAK